MELVKSNGQSKVSQETKARISVLENNVSIIANSVEKLEHKIDSNYSTLHSRISDLRDDLRSDFELKNEKVLAKLDEHNTSSRFHSESLNQRINQIEKWRWMIMGAALVLGYVIAHVKLENLF